SSIWQQMSTRRAPGFLFRYESGRMRNCERSALASAQQTVALTKLDAQSLSDIAAAPYRTRVSHIAPAFPANLPAGDQSVAGEPAVVLMGSSGWWPNFQALEWF